MIDLSKYEKIYDSFDDSHNRHHVYEVRARAVDLAKIYAPELEELAFIAATLHDIGLIGGRVDHENRGAEMIKKDEELKKFLGEEKLLEVAEAVRQHRSSNGHPMSVLAKIVSDADRISSSSTRDCLRRCYYYQLKENGNASEDEKLMGAAKQIFEKFNQNGPGRRTYFLETKKMIAEIVDPIIEAFLNNNTFLLREILLPQDEI